MKSSVQQLPQLLKQGLQPIYLLSGDEPLQLQESRQRIINKAKQQGFSQRELIELGAKDNWDTLTAIRQEMSLFSEQRIIDLRITSESPGTTGTNTLRQWAENIPEDMLLIITISKMKKPQFSSKWMKAIDQAGVYLQIWPIEGTQLGRWIDTRMRQKGLIPEQDVIPILQALTEGNLLAANQEIEKLLLIYGPGTIAAEPLRKSICDSSHYSVFSLSDKLLEGDTNYCLRILTRLLEASTAPTLILWAITKDIRLLATLAEQATKNNLPQLFKEHQVWSTRQSLVTQALQRQSRNFWKRQLIRCQQVDRAIKGDKRKDLPLLLENLIASSCEAKGSTYHQTTNLLF